MKKMHVLIVKIPKNKQKLLSPSLKTSYQKIVIIGA